MSDISNSVYNLSSLEELSQKDTVIHRINPLIKFIVTIVYIAVVVSYGRFDVSGVLPCVLFPVVIIALGDIPVKVILKRLVYVLPFILLMGVFNIFTDRTIWGIMVFLSLTVKGILTVTAALLMIATTGMDSIAAALRMVGVPKVFVVQLMLTYRYIHILLEEAGVMIKAYTLRAPGQKGIHISAWGSFAGQLLLRTFDRAEGIYNAMKLRGFNGEFLNGKSTLPLLTDYLFMIFWFSYLFGVRFINIPALINRLILGVMM